MRTAFAALLSAWMLPSGDTVTIQTLSTCVSPERLEANGLAAADPSISRAWEPHVMCPKDLFKTR